MKPAALNYFYRNALRLVGIAVLLGLAACQSPVSHTQTLTRITPSTTPVPPLTRTPQPPSPTPTVTLTVSPTVLPILKELQGAQVDFWHPWVGASEQYLSALVEEFNARNEWEIQVQTVSMGGVGEIDRQVSASQGSDLPDLVVAYPEQALGWQTQSPVLVDLDQYIFDPIFGFKAQDVADYPLIFWDTPSDADPRFHLPAQRSLVVMVYNQTWAKELGFDTPPATPEDFSQQACAAMRANIEDGDPQNDGTGGWLVDDSPLVVLSWMAGFGAPGFSGGIGAYPFDTPQTRQAFWFVKSLVDKGCAWIGRQPAPYEYFAQRYALFYTGSMEDLSEQTEVMNRLGAKDKWTVLPFPSTGETPTVVSFGPSYFILASDQAHQMASWLFLRWLTTPAQEVRFIRSTGTYPVRASVIPMMADYQRANPAWGTALPLINYARAAPTDLVWDRIRPMLQDAMHQLIQPETKIEQIPDILQMMQEMIRELFNP